MTDPTPGELFLAALDPVVGLQQAGARPVLIMSSSAMGLISPRLIICPVSSHPAPGSTKYFWLKAVV
jgi:mRNA interferase MazF